MKLSDVLLTSLLLSAGTSMAQTEVHYDSTKKDTVKIIKCGPLPIGGAHADSTETRQAKKVRHPRKTRRNCPLCGMG